MVKGSSKEVLDKARRASGEVAEKILNALSTDKKYSIQDISKDSDVNWESTKRYIDVFVKTGLMKEFEEDGKIVYQKIHSLDKDTMYGIPVSDENKDVSRRIYATIQKIWKEKYPDKKLSKTVMQKIASDTVENIAKFKQVPKGWYLYGEMLLVPADPTKDYDYPFKEKDVVIEIERICDIYFKFSNTSEVRSYQYESRKKEMYQIKERLHNLLGQDFKDIEIRNKIRHNLNELAFSWGSKEKNSRALDILEDYCSTTIYLLRNLSADELDKIKFTINQVFECVWNLVGTYELYESLKQYYDKDVLGDFLDSKIEVLEEMAVESLEDLHEKMVFEEPKTEAEKKIHELIGKGKKSSSEAKSKWDKEVEEKRKTLSPTEYSKWLAKKL